MNNGLLKIAGVSDIRSGEAKVFKVEDISIAICNVNGEYFAIENRCTHDNGPLGEGKLFGSQIECPRHGARFDVSSGAVTRQPAYGPVATFPVQVKNEEIFVDISNY